MQAIVDFLKGIGTAITSIFDFIISFFQDLVYAIQLCGKVLLNLPSYLGWIPSSFLSIIMVLFGIVVVYKILGREG